MVFPVEQIVFYVFSALLLGSATMVVFSRNPVRAVLFLVLAFFASSVLWMLLQAEFLSLLLIFVYVGAVMTLFLFVVMMLHVDLSGVKDKFVRYLPFALLVMIAFVGILVLLYNRLYSHDAAYSLQPVSADYSNVKEMGMLLYTIYVYPFELAAVILLVAMIGAITLAFYGRKPNTKSQRVADQLKATKKDRLRVVKMKVDKP